MTTQHSVLPTFPHPGTSIPPMGRGISTFITIPYLPHSSRTSSIMPSGGGGGYGNTHQYSGTMIWTPWDQPFLIFHVKLLVCISVCIIHINYCSDLHIHHHPLTLECPPCSSDTILGSSGYHPHQ